MSNSSEISNKQRGQLFDRLAIGLSALCIVHCAATLLLLATVATLGAAFSDPRIHEYGLAIAVTLAAISLFSGYVRHRKPLPALTGIAGLSLMALALLFQHGIEEFLLSMMGLVLVITAHMRNMRS